MEIEQSKDESRCYLGELSEQLYNFMLANRYSEGTIKTYKSAIAGLQNYMDTHNYNVYTREIGDKYLEYRGQHFTSSSYQSSVARVIFCLNCVLAGDAISKQKISSLPIPEHFQPLLDSFLSNAKDSGNGIRTVERKEYYARRFFNNLSDIGCQSISDLSPETVVKVCIAEKHRSAWNILKLIFRFLYENNLVEANYEALVPIDRSHTIVPSVYSIDELMLVEKTFDRNTPVGKRDYAIFLCLSRYGFRIGDVVNLCFYNVDFKHDRIALTQGKNGNDIDSPLYPVVKKALEDYIAEGRPESDFPYIFISAVAPYTKISEERAGRMISRHIHDSAVEINGRKTGPHAIRASVVTSKINSGASYSETKSSSGWSDTNTMKHYVKLDVENLRRCALPPLPVVQNSVFARILNGEECL